VKPGAESSESAGLRHWPIVGSRIFLTSNWNGISSCFPTSSFDSTGQYRHCSCPGTARPNQFMASFWRAGACAAVLAVSAVGRG
jgi:hypothetical protein